MIELIFAGILVSLAYTELTDLSPGGVIVPAYFVLYMTSPLRTGMTLLLALAAFGIMQLLSHVMILYGRRRFAMYLLTGLLLKYLVTALFTGELLPAGLALSIGYVIPGLIGRDIERQGALQTLLSLAVCCLLLMLLRLIWSGGWF